jgi:integrase
MTFDDLLEDYCLFKVLRPATVRSYQSVVRRIHERMGFRDIDAYTTEDWLKLRKTLLATRTVVTWNSFRRHASALYNYAIDSGHIAASPLMRVTSAPEPQRPPKCIRNHDLLLNVEKYLTEGLYYREANGRSRRITNVWFWALYCRLCYYTGVRLSQAVNLEWCDVDFEREIVLLRAEHSKTRLEWQLPLPTSLIEELRQLRARTSAVSPELVKPTKKIFLITAHQAQGSLRSTTQSHVKKFFQGYSYIVGEKISSHRIRHTTATRLVNATENLKTAQVFLGHRSIKTTLIYVHPDLEQMRAIQKSLL